MISANAFSFLAIGTFVVCCALFVCAWPKMKNMNKWYSLGAVFLPLLSCVLFWSLALHMHAHFNGWPEQIGYHDFSVALKRHAEIQAFIITLTLTLSFTLVPLAALIISLTPKLRPLLSYLSLFYLACVPLAAFMFYFAPKGYLDWFWD